MADLNERLEALAEYYQEDKEIMRFHFYRPDKVLEQFQKFAKEAVPYQAREEFAWEEHPIFITQDEIDAFLVGGGSYRDGRLSTYAFFIQDKSEREKADFVKESYGIGGRSHALSGADHSHADYDGKGLKLERGSYSHPEATVFLKWTQVVKRIEFLIEQDFYLKAADYTRMHIYEREQLANRIVSFYYRLPEEIERPFPDSFLGEEARRELPLLLEQEETAEELVKKMDEALAALPLEFENYEKRVETLAILHQYIEGTYTLFPERQKEISVESGNQQLSLFDFMQEEPFDMEKLEEPNFSQPNNEVADTIDVIGTDGEIITAVPQKRNPTKEDTIPQQKEYAKEGNNFRITDDALGAGSPKEKFRGNIEAISLLKKLEAENRLATPEEQKILSRYVGWGGLSVAFDDRKEEWSQEYQELKGLLSESEYKEARSSTLNAFYTPPTVIKAMYQILENMGLSTGNVLEPSCGVGNFMGLIPENMQGIQMYGVELDPISGKIAGQLYQKNRIEVKGFEKTEYPESFFDCVIGNVPFGNYQVSDRKYDKYSLMIHDYFIVKSLDLIRPGGVVAVITSSRTMDKESEKVRLQFAEKADLLGAMSKFYNYSFNNTVLIALQRPEATLVAGYSAWQKNFHRQVKKGEKGIQIIAPSQRKEKELVEKFDPETNEPILGPDGQPETEVVEHVVSDFRVVRVFDISQTYGEPLPELAIPDLTGQVQNFPLFLQAVKELSPVPIRFGETEGEAKGYYSNKKKEIVVKEDMSESQTIKTLIHEIAHAKLHDREVLEQTGEEKDQRTKEIEAESIAYTVCQYFGLDTSDYSFPYIAGWSDNLKMWELRTFMDAIRRTAGEFIKELEEKMKELETDRSERDGIRNEKETKIGMDTKAVELEQHEGLWHTVEEVEIEKEHFYLMEHNEYGASVAPVLVNGDGKVVAQDLENGLDQEAVKAIREYLEEKEIAKKQEKVETSNASLFEEAEREAAYQIETTGQFFFIQETEEGYDYTFYDQEFQELDGGIYDTFDVTLQEAAKTLLLEEGADLTACRKIDSEMLQEQVERAEYFPQKSYEVLKPLMESEENNVAFRSGYGYVMLQKISEGYECIIYDQAFREIGGQFYENITASKEEVFSRIFQEERRNVPYS